MILGSSNLIASNIKNGVTIFGVKGTFAGWVDSTSPIYSSINEYPHMAYVNGNWFNSYSCWVDCSINPNGWSYVYIESLESEEESEIFAANFRVSSTGSNGYAFHGRYNDDWYEGTWIGWVSGYDRNATQIGNAVRIPIDSDLFNYSRIYKISTWGGSVPIVNRANRAKVWFSKS